VFTDNFKEVLASIRWIQAGNLRDWKLDVRPPDWRFRQLGNGIKARLTPDKLLTYKTLYPLSISLLQRQMQHHHDSAQHAPETGRPHRRAPMTEHEDWLAFWSLRPFNVRTVQAFLVFPLLM
jgi:hypothetical protein